MNAYSAVKHLHVTCVALSFIGFTGRGLWLLCGRSLPRRGWRHWLPHVNDTVLLAAAIALVVMSGQYPLAVAWLTAKVLGLVVYVSLGSIALRQGMTPRTRLVAWLVALMVFGYVVSVALTKNPAGFLILPVALSSNGGG
jgi:uncharacterized membrane protein SirB2